MKVSKLTNLYHLFIFFSLLTVSSLSSAAVIVTVTAHSESDLEQTNVPATFGQIFKPGDVPAGTALAAQLLDGTPVPLQVDKKATHADGSLRHAILTVRQDIKANAAQVIALSDSGTAITGPDVSLSELLAASGFDAVVTINLGGNVYEASARSLLSSGSITPKQWLKGPLVSEWIIGAPLVNKANSEEHPHLTAYFHVRAYAGMDKVRVDVVVENNWTFVSGSDKFTYDVSIKIGGVEKYTKTNLGHFHHSRWHKVFWWNSEPKVVVTHDVRYLQDSKAVPNYDPRLKVSETKLNSLTSSVEPMKNGDLRVRFANTGYGAQIGPLSEWDAIYVVSGDKRALAASKANSTAAGSYSMHYRDENTGLPVSIADYPSLSLNSTTNRPEPGAGGNDYSHDTAHQPSIGYLSYLLTGDYYYLEEMQFWTSFNLLFLNASYRSNEKGYFVGQNRAQVWSFRQLAQTAYITYDTHPLKSQYDIWIQNNIANYTAIWATSNVNNLGMIQQYYYTPGKYSPWQNDWFTWVFGYLVELGYSEATTMRDWLSKWPTGRLGQTNSEYCFHQASKYNINTGPVPDKAYYFSSFRELYEDNFPTEAASPCDPTGQIVIGYASVAGGYIANMQPAVAIAIDAGVASEIHWTRFTQGSNAEKRQQAYNDSPIWAIVPRTSLSGTPPAVSLAATPGNLKTAGDVTLTWSTLNASECTAAGGWSGTKPTSGMEVINVSAETRFTLTCTGADGSRSESITVTFGSDNPADGGGAGSSISATSPAGYNWDSLKTGTNVYIDRGYTFTTIPTTYVGLDVLQTANNDKTSTGDTFITFDISEDATVYVAHVNNSTNIPSWLSSWTNTGEMLSNSDRDMYIYKKDFTSGKVILGGNGDAASMYSVFVAVNGSGGTDTGGTDTGGTDTGGTDTGGTDTGGTDTGGTDTDTGSTDSGGTTAAPLASTGGGGSLALWSLLFLLLSATGTVLTSIERKRRF